MVRTYEDKYTPHSMSPGLSFIHRSAAKNMSGLVRAKLAPSHVSTHIIANLQSYPHLTDLTIIALNPIDYIWRQAPQTTLRHLKWKIPERSERFESSLPDLWSTAQFLINVVESTCPVLESLDITAFKGYHLEHHYDIIESAIYDSAAAISTNSSGHHSNSLRHLRHFGYSYQYSHGAMAPIVAGCLAFATKYPTLTSLTIPIANDDKWTFETLQCILKINAVLPNLKTLKIISSTEGTQGIIIHALAFFAALTNSTLSDKIEDLSITNIKTCFSHEIGTLLGSWRNLKILSVGDANYNDFPSPTPFGDEGRPQFDLYRPVSFPCLQNSSYI